ncbi:MAG: hypothetical protein ACRD0C_02265 [Acidimicrobiia bacterium]
MRTTKAVVAVLIVLGACSGGGDGEAGPETSTSGAASSSTTSATTATSVPAGGASAVPLKPDGIGDLAFGAGEAETRAALTQAFGPPTFDETLPAEACPTGATRRLSWSDLAVLLGPGPGGGLTMVGWTYGTPDPPATPALTTAEGIGVGATVAQLQSTFGDRVQVSEDQAAGVVRFSVQASRYALPLAGVLSGPGDTATVRALYAGSYCGE